jgi:predicted transcriptional regulator
MYAKVPRGEVIGYATVLGGHSLSPKEIWKRFGSTVAISKADFDHYLTGVSAAFALELHKARAIAKPISLAALRAERVNFQPPQFYLRLSEKSLIVRSLKGSP